MSTTLRIATRRSPLAMVQSRAVARTLSEHDSSLETRLVPIQTRGDIDKSAPVTGKGVFIDALREAVAEGRADLAVHSMKDVPAAVPQPLELTTFGPRADVRDALIVREGASARTLLELPAGAAVGTSSIRRTALLATLVRGLEIVPLRGNVDTRLKRLEEGDCDALLLACAGLDRLGLGERIAQRIEASMLVPAPGQGALAVEFSAANGGVRERVLHGVQPDVESCVVAERELTRRLGADCAVPLGAHCVRDGGGLRLTAVVAEVASTRLLRVELAGEDPVTLGAAVADRLDALGAQDLLKANPSGG